MSDYSDYSPSTDDEIIREALEELYWRYARRIEGFRKRFPAPMPWDL